MDSPERFADLPPHAWPRLRALLDAHAPGCARGEAPILMSIGEPRHPAPDWVAEALLAEMDGFARYPVNEGSPALLEAIAGWIARRYGAAIPPERLIALNGSREGLVAAALAIAPEAKRGRRPAVLIPNPFYGAYAAAAAAIGAEPVFVPATEATGDLPDYAALPPETLDRVVLAYACSPANPQGAVASRGWWSDLLALAERHDFAVIADECYSEIWRHAPPPGILETVAEAGMDPERALAIHSLSKRSNLPGLRSGFAAGGPRAIAAMRALRAYGGAPLPGPIQGLSGRLWADEAHVEASRDLYRAKLDAADRILSSVPGAHAPEAGFFLWLPVPGGDGEAQALRLWREAGVRVLPGAYLSREVEGGSPGAARIRVALVAPLEEVERGLARLRDCIWSR